MINSMIAVIREGKIEPLEKINLPDEETEFWLNSSQVALASIWNNYEDDIYDGLRETLYLLSTPANAEHYGDKLIDMFESLDLGLKPKKAYDVDYAFFEEFKH